MSTIWQEDLATKVVWVTTLALSDEDGYVEGSIPGLARSAGVTLKECEAALEKLQAPDPYSRTPDHEGRRIEPIDGGWLILNRAKYRDKNWQEDRAERRRKANHRHYEKRKSGSDNSDHRDLNSDYSGLKVGLSCLNSDLLRHKKEEKKEKELKEKNKTTASPSVQPKRGTSIPIPEDFTVTDEHRTFAAKHNLPDPDREIDHFKDHFRSVAGDKGLKRDWNATFRNWLRNSPKYGASAQRNDKTT
jgi:hypothetical protein